MKLVLLHSPLVGSGTWKPVAAILRGRGHEVIVPELAPVLRGAPPYYPKLARAVAEAAAGAILIAHSGAGALVPSVAERVALAGAVFADALLPHPGRSWFATVPEPMADRLRGLTRDGMLPSWDQWWPQGTLETLLPNHEMRTEFVADLPTLPLAYFEERAPNAAFETRSAYLQLSDGYAAEADHAEANGWPVARLTLHHLAMMTNPGAVAAEIETLAATF